MQASDRLPWHGRVRVRTVYADGREEVEEFNNLITNAGRNLLRDALMNGVDAAIRFVALGSGTAAPSVDDTKLYNERIRKQITKRQTAGDGILLSSVYIAPFEANDFTIQEIGWFAGTSATETKDSGVLIARVLYTKAKTQLESIHIERVDTIG